MVRKSSDFRYEIEGTAERSRECSVQRVLEGGAGVVRKSADFRYEIEGTAERSRECVRYRERWKEGRVWFGSLPTSATKLRGPQSGQRVRSVRRALEGGAGVVRKSSDFRYEIVIRKSSDFRYAIAATNSLPSAGNCRRGGDHRRCCRCDRLWARIWRRGATAWARRLARACTDASNHRCQPLRSCGVN